MRRLLCALAAIAVASPVAAGSFSDWAVVVVAGDDQAAHQNIHTEAFDNARRDVADLLIKRGVSRANLAEFSVRPNGSPAARPGISHPEAIFAKLGALARAAPGGCLVYLTSHGSPQGVLVGGEVLPPRRLAAAVTQACGPRPTAIVLSACFSGSSLPALRGPNRFILTAARRDRSSFGCSESDRYPYFDACVIAALPTATALDDLAASAQACVAKREDEENLQPKSQPQLWIGSDFKLNAPSFAPGFK